MMNHTLIHKHMLGTAYLTNPPVTAQEMEDWLNELVVKIKMEILIPPKAVLCDIPGNEGVTGLVCLSTSHASCHAWHMADRPFMNFDVYSCAEYDPRVILDHLDKFGLIECNYAVVDRTTENYETEKGRVLALTEAA